jgi:hypothetical protein
MYIKEQSTGTITVNNRIYSRISLQKELCRSILWYFSTGNINLSSMQLEFVDKIKESCTPVDDLKIRVLRSFLQRKGNSKK